MQEAPMRRRCLVVTASALMGLPIRLSNAVAFEPPTTSSPVDLLLVLAVDVSSSIDPEEARLQWEGSLAALTDREIPACVQRGTHGAVGIAYVEWSGIDYQHL